MEGVDPCRMAAKSAEVNFACVRTQLDGRSSNVDVVSDPEIKAVSLRQTTAGLESIQNNLPLCNKNKVEPFIVDETIKGYDSIISSMKTECAMSNTSQQEGDAMVPCLLMPSREELQATYGRYASTIKIKNEPFLYCQVCMYKTNTEDDFRIHFLSKEHWQTVTKMEQPTELLTGRNSKRAHRDSVVTSPEKRPRFSKKAAQPSTGNGGHVTPTIVMNTDSGIEVSTPPDNPVSSCKTITLPILTELNNIVSTDMNSDLSTTNTTALSQSLLINTQMDKTDLSSSGAEERIIEKHLQELLEEHPEGRLSYNCLLELMDSHIDTQTDVVELGVICDELMKKVFPSAQIIHLGPNEDLFYSGVRLKHNMTNITKTTRDVGLTGEIFDILPDLVVYTGNFNDSVPRAVILNLLSTHFNQPEMFYWGPQCNKAIQALFPNMEIRRKGKSKVTHFYGVCLKTETSSSKHS